MRSNPSHDAPGRRPVRGSRPGQAWSAVRITVSRSSCIGSTAGIDALDAEVEGEQLAPRALSRGG